MKKFIIILFIFLAISSNNYGQKLINKSAEKQPIWLIEMPEGKYFNYFSGVASSKISLDEAKEKAILSVLSEIVMSSEVTIESEITLFDQETESELISRVTNEIKLKGTSTSITGLKKEEEYWETIKTETEIIYRYWILMKIHREKYVGVDLSKFELKQTYGPTPIIKSAIIPGWGQIHKKETKKGIIFLTGFVTTLTSGIITNNISHSFTEDAKNANGAEWINYYNDLSNQYYITSMISFVISGAIYGYNIFDSISSKGAKIYAYNNSKNIWFAINNKSSNIGINITVFF